MRHIDLDGTLSVQGRRAWRKRAAACRICGRLLSPWCPSTIQKESTWRRWGPVSTAAGNRTAMQQWLSGASVPRCRRWWGGWSCCPQLQTGRAAGGRARWGGEARKRSPEAPISVASWESWLTFAIRSAEMPNERQEVAPRAPTACGRIILKCCLRLGRAIQASEETTSTGTLPTEVARNPARRKA